MRQWVIYGLVFFSVLGAATSPAAQEIRQFDRVRVRLTDGWTIMYGQKARLTFDSLTFLCSGTTTGLPLDQVQSLDCYRGTRAGTGFLVGSAVGLMLSFVLSLDIDLDDDADKRSVKESSERVTYIFLAGAAGGLIGVLIGESSERWEGVALEPGFGKSDDGSVGLKLSLRF